MKSVSVSSTVRKNLYLILYFMLIVVMSGIVVHDVQAQSNNVPNLNIQEGDEWRYFKGVQAPPQKWKESGFDDSNWLRGPSGFGYGQGMNRTYLGDMQGKYLSLYARREFTLGYQRVNSIKLSVACDGPFVVYLNGIEAIRSNTVRKENQPVEQLNISGFIHELFPYQNVLAVECSNDDIGSDDFSFLPVLEVYVDQGGAE